MPPLPRNSAPSPHKPVAQTNGGDNAQDPLQSPQKGRTALSGSRTGEVRRLLYRAHAPVDIVWEWRSKGGQASSAAARADKRLPDRLRDPIEILNKGMEDLTTGSFESSALIALSRAANVLVSLYRLADSEMDLIRAEEDAVAAALVAGGSGDQDLLDKAEAIAARQNQYRIDFLIGQGLVTPESLQAEGENRPAQPVLTDAGRRRFGYQRLTGYTQQDLDDLREAIVVTGFGTEQLPIVRGILAQMRVAMEDAGRELNNDPGPVLDPLTGQAFDKLPAGVKVGKLPATDPGEAENAAEILQNQLKQVMELTRQVEEDYASEIQEERLFGPAKPLSVADLVTSLRAVEAERNLLKEDDILPEVNV